jgi:hypothetical protein
VSSDVHCVITDALKAACNACQVQVALNAARRFGNTPDYLLVQFSFRRVHLAVAFPQPASQHGALFAIGTEAVFEQLACYI